MHAFEKSTVQLNIFYQVIKISRHHYGTHKKGPAFLVFIPLSYKIGQKRFSNNLMCIVVAYTKIAYKACIIKTTGHVV